MEALGQTVLDFATTIAFASLLASFAFTVYRLIRGPSFADRVVALDFLMLIGIGFITVKAVVSSEYSYIDVAIAMALVAFLATVALARYVHQRAQSTGMAPNGQEKKVDGKTGAATTPAGISGQGDEP